MGEHDDREEGSGVPAREDDGIGPGDNSPDRNSVPEPDDRTAHYIGLLSDDDEVSRWKADEALGRIRDPAAVEELIGTLWDDDARVRLKAAWALGQIGDPRAYAPLQRL